MEIGDSLCLAALKINHAQISHLTASLRLFFSACF